MNINYKQPQFELFPANSATIEDYEKPKFLLANLTLSLESLVILTILVIMIALFAFSLGVERGKHLAAQALDERVGAAWNLAPHRPMVPATTATTSLVTKSAIVMPVSKAGNTGNVSLAKPAVLLKAPAVVPAALHFTVQVGTYKVESLAFGEARRLKAKGLPGFLIKKGNFWLLCVGQYPTEESAVAAAKRLQPKFKGLQVRRF